MILRIDKREGVCFERHYRIALVNDDAVLLIFERWVDFANKMVGRHLI